MSPHRSPAISRRTFSSLLLGGAATPVWASPWAASRPKLFVLVVLDYLGADALAPLAAELAPGGFRRLMEHGAWFPDCRHAAVTFSSSTVATLATGAWAAQHGIVADRWFDRSSRKVVPAGEEALEATTLAAQAAADGARVFAIADSSAHAGIFAAGAEARVFFADRGGQFQTLGEPPDWLDEFRSRNSPENLHNAQWLALGARQGAPPLRTLTYDQNHPGNFQALYGSSYFAQSAPFALLRELAAREGLGRGSGLDFVAVISSASAMLGHETGARSPLMRQMLLRLDREIETLLADLDHAAGENAFTLAVVGAHGAPPRPPTDARARMTVNGEALAQAVNRALAAEKLGSVEKYVYPFLYLDASGWRDPEPVRLAAARRALELPAVADYYTAAGACSTADAWRRRFRNSFHPRRSGDAMLSYRPEYIEDFGEPRGVSYGSVYDYDVRVPLFLYGPQFKAGAYEGPVESVDVAPTLARAMGVATPSSSLGRVLGEGFIG